MKVFVAIANYGTKNDRYLEQLLREYRSMPFDVHIVVISNVPKNPGSDIEVLVYQPKGNPWKFPFLHRQMMANRAGEYDLFIYSEDDTLIRTHNVEAFLRVSEHLASDEIAGFLRSEVRPDGTLNVSTVHSHFHWDPRSVVARGPHTFAFFTNEHSASYILTQDQLRRAIRSGGYLGEPHSSRYDLLVTAATDPFTQCGFRKLICISDLPEFLLPHLPNKYVESLGVSIADVQRQISALEEIERGCRPCSVLLRTETRVHQARWSKSYYEEASSRVLDSIPSGAQTVLSIGSGYGALEAELAAKGLKVIAVPLDSVVGACVEWRGIEVCYGEIDQVIEKLTGQSFDCIVIPNLLHLVREPESLLRSLGSMLTSRGTLVALVPNLSYLSVVLGRIRHEPQYAMLGDFDLAGTHVTSRRRIRSWFRRAGLSVTELRPSMSSRAEAASRLSRRLADGLLADEFLVVANARDTSRSPETVETRRRSFTGAGERIKDKMEENGEPRLPVSGDKLHQEREDECGIVRYR